MQIKGYIGKAVGLFVWAILRNVLLQNLKNASNINTAQFFSSLSVGKKHSDFTMIWNSLEKITNKCPTIKLKIHFITYDSKQKISKSLAFRFQNFSTKKLKTLFYIVPWIFLSKDVRGPLHTFGTKIFLVTFPSTWPCEKYTWKIFQKNDQQNNFYPAATKVLLDSELREYCTYRQTRNDDILSHIFIPNLYTFECRLVSVSFSQTFI